MSSPYAALTAFFGLAPFHDGRDDIPPGIQRGVDLLVDGIFGDEMIVGDLALLSGAVDAGQRLVIVAEQRSPASSSAVARPGETTPAPPDWICTAIT